MLLVLCAVIAAGVVAAAVATSTHELPPATGAAQLIPADALLYVHVSTDPDRPAVRRAIQVAQRFPDFPLAQAALTARVGAVLSGSSGSTVDFASQIRPWLGREAAFALLNTPTSTAGSLVVIGVRDHDLAARFVAGNGIAQAGAYRGIRLLRYRFGTVLAFVRHYLVLGQQASVKAAIDAASGHLQSLAQSSVYRAAAAGEPAGRVLDAYASAAGVRRVLAAQGGILGALGVLLYQPALTGTTISVSAVPSGLRLRVHGALDPTLAQVTGGRSRPFAPSLAAAMPEGTTMLLDVNGLDRVAPRVLSASAEGGFAGRIGPLLRRLGAALASEGVNVQRITSIFSGETAVAVAPSGGRAARGSAGGGAAGSAGGPALLIVTRTAHQAATRALLAELEAPLAQLFPPPSSGPGTVAEFNSVPVAGVSVHQLALAPGLQLDYAVFRGLVAVSTSLQAIAGVVRHTRSLSDDPAFKATLGDRPDQVTSLVFLDFSQLLSLAEQTGLTRSASVRALTPDLEKIRAIGLASTRGEADTTAELSLQIP